jgi:hypothetical protein
MSVPNPLWGVPRIQGELLKLQIVVGPAAHQLQRLPLVPRWHIADDEQRGYAGSEQSAAIGAVSLFGHTGTNRSGLSPSCLTKLPLPARIAAIATLCYLDADKAIMRKRRSDPQLVPGIEHRRG